MVFGLPKQTSIGIKKRDRLTKYGRLPSRTTNLLTKNLHLGCFKPFQLTNSVDRGLNWFIWFTN